MINLESIRAAAENLKGVSVHTPLMKNENLSERFAAQVYLKREDLQPVRSYKLRGAYHKISSLSENDAKSGVVCASAGNHAQGVAFACRKLNINAVIYMPVTTPAQKIKQVKLFGKEHIEVVLKGDTFDDAYNEALQYSQTKNAVFVHPFDDESVISGQGTVGLEILEDTKKPIDFLFFPVGGGGLAAGVATVFKQLSPETKLIGVEPEGAASMKTSLENGKNTALTEIDKFVDGAAVKRVGDKTFEICQNLLDEVIAVPEGKVCSTILRLYNEEAIVVEPAGALSIAALDLYKTQLEGRNVVCIVSGSNNDITRMEEIKERSLMFEGLKHYFIIKFPQRPGALREFVNDVLGARDDITYFQFTKKNNREDGPAVVGIELKYHSDLGTLKEKMKIKKISYQHLNEQKELFTHLLL
ncbi:threonine ammonia-lyase IlvA [Kaistella sp.]|uniref:threonine ammonia-lyase IlvA n=1 Tax=Kaistella sp. TaxID=2782235 RepID=UPI002F937046